MHPFLSAAKPMYAPMFAYGGLTARQNLTALLNDGSTIADYQGGVGFTGTTNCSSWANQIGAAGPLLQATGAAQPSISGNSLIFNGSSHFMQASFTMDVPATIYAVFKAVSWAASDRVFDGATFNGMAMLQTGSTPKLTLFAGVDVVPVLSPDLALDTYGVIASVFNGASSTIRLNQGSVVTGNPGSTNAAGFTLGSNAVGSANGNIQVLEVICRSGADSSANQLAINALLQSIWGVA